MARGARSETFKPREKSIHHCFVKAVRDAWLMGCDKKTNISYEGRKQRLLDFLIHAAAWFAIDVLADAILDNHFHTILCNRPDIVDVWSDEEVARRWLHICPSRRDKAGNPVPPTDRQIAALASNSERIAELRKRLSDISWFMQMVNAPFARECNKQEGVGGRFWKEPFVCMPLLRTTKLVRTTNVVVRCGFLRFLSGQQGRSPQCFRRSRFTLTRLSAREKSQPLEFVGVGV